MSKVAKGPERDPRSLAKELFNRTKCGELVKNQTPVFIGANATVQEACATLMNHGIYCAPVQARESSKSFSGVFTFRSLSAFVLQHFAHRLHTKAQKSQVTLELSGFDLRELVCATVGPKEPAARYAKVDQLVQCRDDQSLSNAVSKFLKGSHRVAILNKKGDLVGILTQCMVLRFFVQTLDNLDSAFPQRVSELLSNCSHKRLYTIPETDSVLKALSVLHEKKVSSLAVTQSSGQLVSSIALRDIQEVFRTKQRKMLFAPVHDFVVYVRSLSTNDYSIQALHDHSTVSHAIQRMINTKLHRVWIVDAENKPTELISVSDIIAFLCRT